MIAGKAVKNDRGILKKGCIEPIYQQQGIAARAPEFNSITGILTAGRKF